MIIPESDAVTRIKTSIGQALAMVENSTCVCVLFGGSLWTRRITRGARTIPINGRSLEKKLLRKDKKVNSQKELLSVQINDVNNQFYGSIAVKMAGKTPCSEQNNETGWNFVAKILIDTFWHQISVLDVRPGFDFFLFLVNFSIIFYSMITTWWNWANIFRYK